MKILMFNINFFNKKKINQVNFNGIIDLMY
jgi:hypothetical protein